MRSSPVTPQGISSQGNPFPEMDFAAVLDGMADVFLVLDQKWRFVYANAAAERLLSRDRAQLQQKVLWEVLPQLIGTEAERGLRRVAAGGRAEQIAELSFSPGQWGEASISPHPQGISILLRDITDWKATRAESARMERLFQHIADTSPSIIYIYDCETGTTSYSNERWEAVLGYRAEEMVGQPPDFLTPDFIHPDDQAWARENGHRTWPIADKEVLVRTIRVRHKDGSWRWLESREVVFERDESGAPRSYLGAALDVTDQRRIERQLRERFEEIETLMAVMPIGIIKAEDPSGLHITCNPAAMHMTRTPPGGNPSQLRRPGEGPINHHFEYNGKRLVTEDLPMRVALRDGIEVRDVEMEAVFDDGERRRFYVYASPLFDEEHKVRGAFAAMVDITERAKAEKRLFDFEERFRIAQEASPMSFNLWRCVRDEEGEIIDFEWEYANPASARMMRTLPSELEQQSLMARIEQLPNAPEIFGRYSRVVETGITHQTESYYDVHGILGWYQVTVVKVGDGLAVTFNNVTERKLLEDELRLRIGELAEANQRQDEFLTTLARELREPDAAIRRVLSAPDASEERIAEARASLERILSGLAETKLEED